MRSLRFVVPAAPGITRVLVTLAALAASRSLACADESGVSFWLPGQYASFAAIAPDPGFSLPMFSYFYSGSAQKDQPLQHGGDLDLGVSSQFFGQFIVPTYTPDVTFLGARPSFSLAFFPGYNTVTADAQLGSLSGSRTDSLWGFGDLYPTAQLYWNSGVNNWMTYVTGDIPVGDYDSDRLANLGIGHGAIDFGGAYTYLNPNSGWEFSGTAGVTFNFENQSTDYTNGIDAHFDWGVSKFLSEKFFVGAVGYAYQQLTPDKGQPADPWQHGIANLRDRPAAWIQFQRGRGAHLHQPQRLFRVRREEPPARRRRFSDHQPASVATREGEQVTTK